MATTTAVKNNFKTVYGEHDRVLAPAGEVMADEYGYTLDSHGRKVLEKTGQRNVYEEIQSYAESCKIENILKRVAAGDMSDFRPQGIFQDISDIPTDLNTAQAEMLKVEAMFKQLPAETKAKYHNSVTEFIAKTGTESWLIDTGYIQPKKEDAEAPVTLIDPADAAKEAAKDAAAQVTK